MRFMHNENMQYENFECISFAIPEVNVEDALEKMTWFNEIKGHEKVTFSRHQ